VNDRPGYVPAEDRDARLLEHIEQQLYIGNLLTYAQTYPFKQPEVREQIEKRLGL
jgi:hypothetical protein